jgi:hypothetical protein
VSGATASSYALDSDDVGIAIRVLVTALNSSGSNSAESAPTTDVSPGPTLPLTLAITSAPIAPTTSSSATLAWTTTGTVESTECQLEGSAFEPCSSPASYASLAVGPHSFAVRVTNTAGATTDTANWNITAPTLTWIPASGTTCTIYVTIEAERARTPDRADAFAVDTGAVRLACVFEDEESVLLCDLHNWRHLRRMTVDLDWDDRPGSKRDGLLDEPRGHGVRVRVHVDEDRPGRGVRDGEGRRDERVGRRDYVVTATDSGRSERELERRHPRVHSYRVARLAIVGDLAFEDRELVAQDPVGPLEEPRELRDELVRECLLLGA